MYIYYLILILYLIKLFIYLITIFQQNHYDYKKYFKSLKKYYLYKPYQYKYYISLLFIFLSIISKYFLIFACISLILSFIFKNKYIIKLRITKRIIRLIITNIILSLGYFILTSKIIYLFSIYPLILPYILILSNLINKPIELLIAKYYYKKAKKKLELYPNLVKIGITGSFGKTSTKDILNSVLEKEYLTLKTPASYNTLMGLSYTINNHDLKLLDFLILEMGAFKSGEIKQMSSLFKPNIRVITEIGMQHMSTFKTISNVIKAKFEITSNICSDDILILNYENEYIRNYDLTNINTNRIYTYGINYGNITTRNIEYFNDKIKFDIYYHNQYKTTINSKLISKSNIMNILSCYSVVIALRDLNYKISDEVFKDVISNITPSPHRMEYKKVNNITIYDDSYSSNIVGFINACDVLKKQKGKRIIITPGIVDGGIYDRLLNEQISSHIINTFDEIYLINNKSSKIIEESLIKHKKDYYTYDRFIDAYNTIISKYSNTSLDIYLLIENDLPDSFIER